MPVFPRLFRSSFIPKYCISRLYTTSATENLERLENQFVVPLQKNSYQWMYALLTVTAGVGAGVLFGGLFAHTLGPGGLGLFTYIPDDDDDDDDDDEVATKITKNFFGDHQLSVNFLWQGYDDELFLLVKQKLSQELEDLGASMKEKNLKGFDLKEASLTEKYLKDLIKLVDQRKKEESSR